MEIQTDTSSDIQISVKKMGDTNIETSTDRTTETKKRTLNALHTRKKQLDYFIHDLETEKMRYNRMVRSMVRMLQQEILNKGKALAKEIEQGLEDRIQGAGQTVKALETHIRHLEQDQYEPISGEDKSCAESENYDYEEFNVSLPARDPFQIDMQQVYKCIGDLKVTLQDYVDEPFPEREELVKEGVEVQVSGVGFWDSQRPTFHLMPRNEELVAFLYRHSQKIRMAYLEDKTWLTFQDSASQPVVGGQVFGCHPDDRCWYRAVVVKNIPEESLSTVKFVDYGETKQVPWSDLLPSRKDLYTDSKNWAFECVIAEDIDPKKCQDARWNFNSTLYDVARSCVPLICTPIKQVELGGEKVWLVDLKVTNKDGTVVDIGKEVREKLSFSKPQSSIACRDIREEFQTQLSEIEKERERQKAQKEGENLLKQTDTGPEGGEVDVESSKCLNTESAEQEATPSDASHVTGVSTNQDQVSAISASLTTQRTSSDVHEGIASVPRNATPTGSHHPTVGVVEESLANTQQNQTTSQLSETENNRERESSGSLSTVAASGEGTPL